MPDNTISSINKLQTQKTEVAKDKPKEKKEADASIFSNETKPPKTGDEASGEANKRLQDQRIQEINAKINEFQPKSDEFEAEKAQAKKDLDAKNAELEKLRDDEKERLEKEKADDIAALTTKIQNQRKKLKNAKNPKRIQKRIDDLKDDRRDIQNSNVTVNDANIPGINDINSAISNLQKAAGATNPYKDKLSEWNKDLTFARAGVKLDSIGEGLATDPRTPRLSLTG